MELYRDFGLAHNLAHQDGVPGIVFHEKDFHWLHTLVSTILDSGSGQVVTSFLNGRVQVWTENIPNRLPLTGVVQIPCGADPWSAADALVGLWLYLCNAPHYVPP